MGSHKSGKPSSGGSLSLKTGNKLKRQALYVAQKKAANKSRHEERHRRRREERNDPELRQERLEKNKTITIEEKRVWDDGDDDRLGAAVDVAQVKRKRLEEEERQAAEEADAAMADAADDEDSEVDSMLGSDEEDEEDEEKARERIERMRSQRSQRTASVAASTTSTNIDLTDSLAPRFPGLFNAELTSPKILVTTSLNATIHKMAQEIASVFPNSHYVPRSAHRYSYKYSVREIARYAQNRGYTALVVVKEDLKRPTSLSIIHLSPEALGPTMTYSCSNYTPGKVLPGHGVATNHYPELLLNNFKTPLGLLAAKSLHVLYGPPELQGRNVVTFHNQRDYIFVRRHRYVFRERKGAEKNVTGTDGKDIAGMEGIRVGLQELGPRFTLKLRRVDKGVGRAGSEGEDALPWDWKPKMEKKRTRFNL